MAAASAPPAGNRARDPAGQRDAVPDERDADTGRHQCEVGDEGERVLGAGADGRRKARRPGRPGGAALTPRTRGPALTGGTGRTCRAALTRRAGRTRLTCRPALTSRAALTSRTWVTPFARLTALTRGSWRTGLARRSRLARGPALAPGAARPAVAGCRRGLAGHGLGGPGTGAGRGGAAGAGSGAAGGPASSAVGRGLTRRGAAVRVRVRPRRGVREGIRHWCSSGVRSYLDSTSFSSTVSRADTSSDPRQPRRLRTNTTTTAVFRVSPGHPEGYCCPCRFSGCTAHTNRSIPARSSPPSNRRRRRGSTRRCRRTTSRRGAAVRGTRRSPGRGWARRCRPPRCRSAS